MSLNESALVRIAYELRGMDGAKERETAPVGADGVITGFTPVSFVKTVRIGINQITEDKAKALESFGQKVAYLRKISLLTQDELAQAAGISRSALRNIESGQDTRLSTILSLSEALSIPVVRFIGGLQPELEKKFSEAERALVDRYRS